MDEEISGEKTAGKPDERASSNGQEVAAPDGSEEVRGHEVRKENMMCPRCGYHQVVEVDTEFKPWINCYQCGYDLTYGDGKW